MYWNRLKELSALSPKDPNYQAVLKYLAHQFNIKSERVVTQQQPGSTQSQTIQPILHVKQKSLEFYKEGSSGQLPVLFEVAVDLSLIDESAPNKELTNYKWTHVYVVRAPKPAKGPEEEEDSKTQLPVSTEKVGAPKESEPSREWYLLDGESQVLHELNARFGKIDIENDGHAREYLDFFSSFLCAEEGVFAFLEDSEDLKDIEDSLTFKKALFENHYYVIRGRSKRFLPKWDAIKTELEGALNARKLEEENLKSNGLEPVSTDSGGTTYRMIKHLVLYGRNIFDATFKVSDSGSVEMTEDTPKYGDLEVKLHTTFLHRKSGLILFTKSDTKTEIPAFRFMNHAKRSAYPLSNLLVVGDVEFKPGEILTAIECSNLQFLGNVLFDHCQVSNVFRFEGCQFLGTFGAPGTRFSSQVSVKHSEIYALPEISREGPQTASKPKRDRPELLRPSQKEAEHAVALILDYARIDGSLSLECLTAFASVRCRHLTVQSDANFSGMQVIPLVDEMDEQDKAERKKLEVQFGIAHKDFKFRAVGAGGPVLFDLQRSSFTGSLSLGTWTDNAVIKGAESLSRRRVTVCGACRFDTLSIGKSMIIEGLAIVSPKKDEVWCRGGDYDPPLTLNMSSVTVKGNIQSWDYDSWDATRERISPPVLVDGAIDLKWSVIDGYVDLRMTHVTRDLDCIGMRAAWLTLEPSDVRDVTEKDDERRRCGEIPWAKYSVVDESPLPRVSDNASSKWSKQFVARMSVIKGDLKLANVTIPGGLTLTGATIGGTVDVRLGSHLGQIKALPAFGICTEFEKLKEKEEDEPPLKRLVIKRNAFLGRLSIRNSTVAGPLDLWGACLGSAAASNAARKPVIDIATSDLKGGLYFHPRSSWEGQDVVSKSLTGVRNWRDNPAIETEWSDHSGYKWIDRCGLVPDFRNFENGQSNYFWVTVSNIFHTTVNGDVEIMASDIRADLDLSNTRVCGRIRLNDSHVRCDVRALVCLQELDAKLKTPSQSEQGAALHTELQTQCSHFEFQSLRCDGDMILAGLATDGDVDGRNAVVRGHAEFFSESGQATIAGNLNLCGCEVGLLQIGDQSFRDEGKGMTIDLARATIATFKIREPLPEAIKQINLQGIKVGHWESTEFLSLLKATKPYDSWAYKSIENWLAAKGNDDKAEDVFRAKNLAEWDVQAEIIKDLFARETNLDKVWPAILCAMVLVASMAISIWPWSQFALLGAVGGLLYFLRRLIRVSLLWLWHQVGKKWIWGKGMGFGTVLSRAVLFWALLSLGLALVLSKRENVQPTFAAVNAELGKTELGKTELGSKIQLTRNELKKQIPQEREWGFWNHGLWLALDITVPLVPFNLHDEWEPRESTERTVMPCCSRGEMLLAPKTLANGLVLISWGIWTLIATGMASVIRTRK